MKDKKCILLVRVSTEIQSYKQQEHELFELALKDGYNKDQIKPISYKESGIKLNEDKRKGLQDMYSELDKGEYDCVYVWEVSRIARRTSIIHNVLEYLVNHNIQLIIKNPYYKLLKEDGNVDYGVKMGISIFAEMGEAEMKTQRVRFAKGKKEKASEGRYVGANIPYGYKVDSDNGRLIVVDEEKSKLVVEVYNLYEQGISQTKIPIELEKRGYPTITISLVSNILKNESYTGKECEEKKMKGYAGRGEWTKYARKYPPIISTEQFEKCRNIAQANNTKKYFKGSNIYYASNLIECPECGGVWAGYARQCYYGCYFSHMPTYMYDYGNYKSKGKQCQNRTTISINILDSLLWKIALLHEHYVRMDDTKKEISIWENEISNLSIKIHVEEDNIKEIYKRKERLRRSYILDDSIDDYEHDNMLKELRNKEIIYQQEIVSLKNQIEQIKLRIKRLEKKTTNSDKAKAIEEKLKGVISQKAIKEAISILERGDEIHEELLHLEQNADDKVRYDLIHEHIEKVNVENISLQYQLRTKKREKKIVKGKLIKVYTHYEYSQSIKNEPSQYPYYFVAISNDGKGGNTIFQYMKYDHEFKNFDKNSIKIFLNNGAELGEEVEFLEYPIKKLKRFVDKNKTEKRRKLKEEKNKILTSPEYIKRKEEEDIKRKEEKRKYHREYVKKRYHEQKEQKKSRGDRTKENNN